MNTNEVLWQVLRSGFPLLILVLYGMLLTSVWRSEKFDQKARWKWSSIIVLPGLIGLAIFLIVAGMESDNQQFMNIMAVIVLFLPFTGVFAWLVATR